MKEKILVLAKTYPNLSRKYVETVCVAGITNKGEWRRLYPIPFRKLPFIQRFKKFEWIEVETIKNTKEKLQRKESCKADAGSIKVLGNVGTGFNRKWNERNRLLLSHVNKSLEDLEEQKKSRKVSLGLIKPAELMDFTLTPLEECRDWEKDLIKGTQKTLFGNYNSPLDRIPWKFSYVFKCNDSECKGHCLMCEDWELLESWRSWKNKYQNETLLWEKIKQKYFEWMKNRNLHFIVGTESRFNKFLIIGLYYPPKL
ncbi:hypothetical protein KKG83_03190 [Candidatus Micrarchaeota archaeon]|nr:hypothetical protein [Candidatus Micrarchaeota archaeon]MBU2476450.1 hypothetical protein [Candidatus Micrarchaeota archaeon]